MNNALRFDNPALASALLERVRTQLGERRLRLMEVCGTHTVAIFRTGLRQALAGQVDLLSGPGCPVCVTAQADIDAATVLARQPGVILCTYGDMMRVPGTLGTLQEWRARGCDVRVVHSALDALKLALMHTDRRIVFLAVGFETTAPATALTMKQAKQLAVDNFHVLCLHKTVPEALRALLAGGELGLDGLILPGHVAVITGLEPFQFLSREYGIPAVIAGFELVDLVSAVEELVGMATRGQPAVRSAYGRAVRDSGNAAAKYLLKEVFTAVPSHWRGLGMVPASGLAPGDDYRQFDARLAYALPDLTVDEPAGCRCGDMICGRAQPPECKLFAVACTPTEPVGPCMVSSEGVCAAWYAYRPEEEEQ